MNTTLESRLRPSDYVRAQIENHAGAVSGHKTKIAKLAIDWGWTPHMHLEDVELSNADWGKADHMFKAQQIEFDIHLWSLLHGNLVLPHLMLQLDLGHGAHCGPEHCHWRCSM